MGQFWTAIREEHWDKKPGLFTVSGEGTAAIPYPIDAAGALAGMKRVHIDFTRFIDLPPRFITGDGRTLIGDHSHLPSAEDTTLEGYMGRQVARAGGRCGILAHGFARFVDADTWYRLGAFLDEFYRFAGHPGDGVDLALFMGNYAATPFGIHIDNASVFTFVLAGKKTLLYWPPDYFPDAATAGRERVADHRARAHAVHAVPGDIIFAPANWWHIGVQEGDQLTATAAISIFYNHKAVDLLAGEIARRATALLGSKAPRRLAYPHTSDGAPAEMAPSVAALRAAIEDDATAQLAWATTWTGNGFRPGRVPEAAPGPELAPGDRLVRHRQAKIMVTAPRDVSTVVSTNGRQVTTSLSAPECERLLAALGEPRPVAEVIERGALSASAEGPARALLSSLVGLRAVVRP